MVRNSSVQYSTAMLPSKKFDWWKYIKILLFLVVLFCFIYFPYEIGEIFGKWLNSLVEGFKNSFKI